MEKNNKTGKDLDNLFDAQITTLKDRGCRKQIVGLLENKRSLVLREVSRMTFADGHIPFLPVIPRTLCNLNALMKMVRYEEKAGYSDLESTQVYDLVDTPDEPYYIFDVEDGKIACGILPYETEMLFRKQPKGQVRNSLTGAEAIALCTHTNLFSRHVLWITRSAYPSPFGTRESYILGIGLGKENMPCLSSGPGEVTGKSWGVASCGSRESSGVLLKGS